MNYFKNKITLNNALFMVYLFYFLIVIIYSLVIFDIIPVTMLRETENTDLNNQSFQFYFMILFTLLSCLISYLFSGINNAKYPKIIIGFMWFISIFFLFSFIYILGITDSMLILFIYLIGILGHLRLSIETYEVFKTLK